MQFNTPNDINVTFQPFPTLETERMELVRPDASQAEDFLKMRGDPEVMRYIPRPIAQNIDDVLAWLQIIDEYLEKNEKINWGMRHKESNTVIGMIGFPNIDKEHARAEVGYSVSKAWQRQGYTQEALKAVLHYGFQVMKLHSICAITDAENEASGKLLLKAGFRKEGLFSQDFWHNGQFRDSTYYAMLEKEYSAKLPLAVTP
jgi:ribosomal-protein-alanine N-acetyltransferase